MLGLKRFTYEVCADDGGFWVLVRNVDGPDTWEEVILVRLSSCVRTGWELSLTCACADIEDTVPFLDLFVKLDKVST